MSNWNKAETMAQKQDTSGVFIKLPKDGDTALVAFVGEPYPREVVWNGERYVVYDKSQGRSSHPSGRHQCL